jgi:hypothetical protein
MGYSFQHSSGALPVTLHLDETEVERPCPTCARVEGGGTVTIRAAADRMSGTATSRCSAGHLVMVNWTREQASPPAAD